MSNTVARVAGWSAAVVSAGCERGLMYPPFCERHSDRARREPSMMGIEGSPQVVGWSSTWACTIMPPWSFQLKSGHLGRD